MNRVPNERIVIPAVSDPAVSIVFPVYGARHHLVTALQHLEAHTRLPYEVIAVDNASPDGTGQWIADHVEGIDLVRHEENLGFGAACNAGAARARADAVCLLNTDAFVHAGWLEPLLETLALPGAGAVYPQFLEVDGTLQEAGSLVDPSGNGTLYGNTDDPRRARYQFRRTVDYGSAACLVARRSVYAAHGGLDPVFGIAYCEDIDLSFRLRASGWSTYYEPRSVVTHVRGASGASDFVRDLLERNTGIIRERWGDVLASRAPLRDLDVFAHRLVSNRDAVAPDRVLVVADEWPEWDGPTGRALRNLAGTRPDARIAVLTPTMGEPEPEINVESFETPAADAAWPSIGVEIAEEPGGPAVWLRHRLAHYDYVWIPDNPAPALVDQVRRSQPQAVMVDDLDLEELEQLGWGPAPHDPV